MADSRKVSLPLCMTPQVITIDQRVRRSLTQSNTAVAVGISGGKDSCAVAFMVDEHLSKIKFHGPRVLIHADLGLVEWKDSLPTCERLADTLGWQLVVAKRAAGDMMDRWNKRWSNNVDRYVNLECVKLIPPWSTASMRFCTSELKRDPICSALVKRYPGHEILSVSGIRRDESPRRAKAPITKDQCKLTNKTHQTTGYDWHAILEWNREAVMRYLNQVKKFRLHEAYTKYQSSRVSCSFCILGSYYDLTRSAICPSNRGAYEAMVKLEVESTFSFQDKQWLADIAPQWNSTIIAAKLPIAKENGFKRRELERQIPEHLLYTAGWPTVIPTTKESELLARVRRGVAKLIPFEIHYATAKEVRHRYEQLYEERYAN